jgi:hypothetical protein
LWERLIVEFGEALGFAIHAEPEVQDAAPTEADKPEDAVLVTAG